MKGPVREIIPAPSQQVRIRIPDGRRITRARLLVGGGELRYQAEGNSIRLEVPSIGVHEVVALDFAG
jgi:hypothetical protein